MNVVVIIPPTKMIIMTELAIFSLNSTSAIRESKSADRLTRSNTTFPVADISLLASFLWVPFLQEADSKLSTCEIPLSASDSLK